MGESKSKSSATWNRFVKKTALGSVTGAVVISSALMITPDLAAQASNTVQYAQAATQPFKDVPTSNYAYDAILWGKDKGLINGYSNGLFGPNNNVTEAQFVKMVANYFELKDTDGNVTKNKGQGSHWADSYYDAMAKHGVPLNGYFDNTFRNEPMKRGSVAQAFGYLLGSQFNLKDSIDYLLNHGITSGQNPQFEGKDLYKFFGSTNNLTRAQVITLLHRIDSKNMNTLSSTASGTGSYEQDINSKAKEGYSYLDVSLAKLGNGEIVGSDTETNKNSDYQGNPSLQNDFFLSEEEVEKYKQTMEVVNKEKSEFDNVDDAIQSFKDKYKKYEITPVVTELSKKIESYVPNDYKVNFLGHSDYSVYAFKNDKLVYTYLNRNETYKKLISYEFDFKHSVSLSRNDSIKDYDLYRNDIDHLLVNLGLSKEQSKETLNLVKKYLEEDFKVTGDYTRNAVTHYEKLFNEKVVVSYNDVIVIEIY